MQFTKYCLLIITIIIFKFSYAQTDNQFWFVAPEVNDEHGNPPNEGQSTYLRFSNTEDYTVKVTITQPANVTFSAIEVDVLANSTESIEFRRGENNGVDLFDLNTIENYLTLPAPVGEIGNKGNKGLKIEATGRITAYYEISAQYNQEIMALKGRNGLGTEFFVPFQTHYDTDTRYSVLYSAIDIVASLNLTNVTITPTADMMIIEGGIQTRWRVTDGDYSITLNAGETFSAVPYDVDGDGDNAPYDITRRKNRKLGGTKVVSNKPIAVNTKDDLVEAYGVDIVADQLVPISIINEDGNVVPIIGNDYVVIKNTSLNPANANQKEYAYIIPTGNNTEIYAEVGALPSAVISGGPYSAGDQIEFEITDNTVFTSPDDPFYVFHMSGVPYAGTRAQMGGAIVPSVTSCTGSYKVSFVRSSTSTFVANILVRDGGQNGFLLNGNPLAIPFVEVISGEWWAASIDLTADVLMAPLVNVIENVGVDRHLFHLGILNGSDDCFYGYFSDFNPINVQGNIGGTLNTKYKACYGERVELVAYGADRYFWISNLSPSFLDDPNAERPVIYPTDDRKYTVVGYGDCNLTDTTEIEVTVAEPIIADFALNSVIGCSPLDITIANHSEDDWPVSLFRWTFGDGATSSSDSDTLYHTYTNNSDTIQNLRFSLVTENSFHCLDTLETDIVVKPDIHAAFTPSPLIGCNPLTVGFTDNSTGHLDKYRWVFGDGSIATTEGSESHVYVHTDTANTVDYNMELRLTSPFLCRDTARTTIRVYPHLAGEFAIDVDEGCSPLEVKITNVSEGEDHIVLDYGDGSATLDQASFISSTHTYINNGDSVAHFPIELYTENIEGCVKIWYDTITVYPIVQAAFNVDNNNICNSGPVRFFNNSNYGTHRASSFIWSFGDGYNSDTTSNDFYKTYINNTDNDQTRNVQLIAKSQYGCADTINSDIFVYRAMADFIVNESDGCSPLDVEITNLSSGSNIGTWLWDYDDTTTDPNQNPGMHHHIYNNVSGSVDNRDLRLTVIHATQAWCSTYKEIPINVFSELDVTYTPVNPTQCDSTNVIFNSTINPYIASTDFEWSFGDGTSASVEDPTHNYRNTTNPGQFTYDVQVSVETPNGCTDTAKGTVNINPRVRAFFTIDESEGCSPHTITVTPTNYIGIDEYHWDFDGDGTVDVNTTTASQQTFIFPRNTSGGDKPYNVTLEVFDPSGSCNDTYIVPVTVFSEAKANFDNQNYIDCNSFSLTFDNLSFNSDTWHWDFGDATSSSAFEPNKLFTNAGSIDSVYNVTLEVTSNRGCTHDTSTQITVYPYVKAAFSIDVSSDCSPLTVNITNNSSGNQFYWYWDDDDASVGSTDQNPGSHIYTLATGGSRTDSLILIVGNGEGCYDTLKRAVTVHSSLNADFTITQPDACNPSDVLFTDASLPAVGGYTYNWNFGDGTSAETMNNTISKTYTNTSNVDAPFTVSLNVESTNGCSSVVQKSLTVYRYVKADFDIDVIEDCSPLTINISNNSRGGTYRWYWNSQTAAGAANYITNDNLGFTHTYTNSSGSDITFYLTLVAENANGCADTLTKQILVHSSIDAQFTFSQPDSCNQSDVVFTNASIGGSSYNMNWDFGDATTLVTASNTVNKIFVNNLTDDHDFLVTMTAESENGCLDQFQDYVTVYSRLSANFSIPLKASCPPFENAVIQNTSIGNNSNTYQWFVDGVPESTVTAKSPFIRTYTNSNPSRKDYQIRLLASNVHGCASEKIDTISVYERVIAKFNMHTDEGCTPLQVGFDNQSQKTTDTKYLWNFGDGATSSDFEPSTGHEFFNTSRETDKPYTISLKVTSENYCTHDTTDNIIVYHQPLAKFFIDKTSSCPPLVSNLDKRESLGETMWEWRFGDGSALNTGDEVLTHTYQSTGVGAVDGYNLELWVGTAQGCVDSTYLTVNVFPSVTADFNFTASNYCSPADVGFINNSSSWVTNYDWKFRDGNTSNLKEPQNRYENTGIVDKIYQVYLRVSSQYNCWDTISKPLTVFVQPRANFYLNPVLLKYPENIISINNTTNFGPFDYLWEFGDLNTSESTVEEPGSFEYDYWGEKVVELSVESQTNANCKDYYADTILIMPPEVNADFTSNIDGGCLDDGLVVEFTAAQSAFNETYSYEWDFGDGSSNENGQIVDHTYTEAGIYNVQLTARSQEVGISEDYEYKTIKVYANPEVNFEVSPEVVMLDATTLEARVKFYNMSICNDTSGCAYTWYFGDGNTSISKDVTHGYSPDPDDIPIEYDVTLFAETLHRCRDSLMYENKVKIIGAGAIEFPNAFTPDGYGPPENEMFRPVSEGVVEYELYIYNRWGELIFTTKDLSAGWDGNINGDAAKPDVYVWKAKGKFTNGKAFEIAGDVTLIR